MKTSAPKKLAITVLAGGPGGERDVSLASGKAVTEALQSLGHDVVCGDVGPDNLGALARQVDCVFVALHGRFGEDGQIQEILERRGLAYVGSGPQACALAMDKARSKARFAELGIPTPRYAVADAKGVREAVAAWSLPVVVKPVREGSSLNCFIVRQFEQFRPTVEKIVGEYGSCLVEEYIPGKEVTVAILGDRSLPPLEIRTKREFYDYQAKYVDEDTEYDFSVGLPPDLLESIGRMSLQAHQGLGCRDFSRVDWRVDERDMKPYALELNVIPGLTSHSLLPKAAEKAGLNMPQMCQFVVDLAVRRGTRK
jgi:D-alanine-D-alanine ligase